MTLEQIVSATSAAKAELRGSALRRRDGVDFETRARFAARLARVGPILVREFSADRRPVVSLFSAIGSESDATALALAFQATDIPLVLPVDWSHGAPLIFRCWHPGDRLAIGPLGIAEPREDASECEPDVLFLPMVAFDRCGRRLGYGAGNIDRTLALLRRRKSVQVIGVAYAVQEEVLVPTASYDESVDFVVTDREILFCQR